MPFTGPLEDRLAIRERIEAYSDAVFRRDAEDWIANWAEDGVWRLTGTDIVGRGAIKAAWLSAMEGFSFVGFFAIPGHIEIDGQRATARVYTQEVLVEIGGNVRRIVGAYDDELVRRDGVWLFVRRAYTVLRMEG